MSVQASDDGVMLSLNEMWELAKVGALLMGAAEEMNDKSPGRNQVVRAANALFAVMNQVDGRDSEWPFRGPMPDLVNEKS